MPKSDKVFQCLLPMSNVELKCFYYEDQAAMDPNVGVWTFKEAWSRNDIGEITHHIGLSLFGVANVISKVNAPEWWDKRPRILI